MTITWKLWIKKKKKNKTVVRMLISLIFPFWQALQLHALPIKSHWKIIKINQKREIKFFIRKEKEGEKGKKS